MHSQYKSKNGTTISNTPLNCGGWQNKWLVKFLAPVEHICIKTTLINLFTAPKCLCFYFIQYRCPKHQRICLFFLLSINCYILHWRIETIKLYENQTLSFKIRNTKKATEDIFFIWCVICNFDFPNLRSSIMFILLIF